MSKLKWMWLVAVPMAIGACTTQWQMMKEASVWEMACADVAAKYNVETCNYAAPEVVRESWLMMELSGGAWGVFVEIEWRIYLSPASYIYESALTPDIVEYHESIHAVLSHDNPLHRCESERVARKMTDAKYGTDSLNSGWEFPYGCSVPGMRLPI